MNKFIYNLQILYFWLVFLVLNFGWALAGKLKAIQVWVMYFSQIV